MNLPYRLIGKEKIIDKVHEANTWFELKPEYIGTSEYFYSKDKESKPEFIKLSEDANNSMPYVYEGRIKGKKISFDGEETIIKLFQINDLYERIGDVSTISKLNCLLDKAITNRMVKEEKYRKQEEKKSIANKKKVRDALYNTKCVASL